jgi:hypothetical protein
MMRRTSNGSNQTFIWFVAKPHDLWWNKNVKDNLVMDLTFYIIKEQNQMKLYIQSLILDVIMLIWYFEYWGKGPSCSQRAGLFQIIYIN